MDIGEMKIGFLHVCEDAFFSEDKKLSIINVFEIINSKGCPALHPRFSIALSLLGQIPTEGLVLEIVDPAGKSLASTPIKRQQNWDEKKKTNLVLNFIGTPFPSAGEYKIQVTLNGKRISSDRNDAISVNQI